MIINGRALASQLYRKVAAEVVTRSAPPKMAIVTCAPTPATQQYLELKRRKAASVGIPLTIIELPEDATTEEVVQTVTTATMIAAGVVVQLPLPKQIDREVVLAAIPATHDPDVFMYTGKGPILPPVVAAIDYIAQQHGIAWVHKKVVVVGYGRLVGKPAALFATAAGADVTVVTEETPNTHAILKSADIIITGVGKAHFITPMDLAEGVVVFDAGASEDGGVVVGDVHPSVAAVASLFTPVPGGIGPITVAALFDNLLTLTRQVG